jgi:peptidylprolyl isomerase
MKSAEMGSRVKVHYTGKLDNGTIFDSSREREPLEFTIGNGQLIPAFENAVSGMTVGDSKTIKIAAADAYGEHREELVVKIENERVPEEIDPMEGLPLQLKTPDGGIVNAVVTAVEKDHIVLDANHPLAGQDLTFDIELLEIL